MVHQLTVLASQRLTVPSLAPQNRASQETAPFGDGGGRALPFLPRFEVRIVVSVIRARLSVHAHPHQMPPSQASGVDRDEEVMVTPKLPRLRAQHSWRPAAFVG